MRIALTGATGFIGSHIAETFVRQGHEVVAIVRATSRTDFLRSLGVTLVTAGLHDAGQLQSAMRRADLVIHAAAKVETYGFWRDFIRTTIEGTGQVLEAAVAAGVPRFIHLSSVGVYGWPRPDGQPHAESSPYGTPYRWNYYSRSKIAAEQLVRAAQQAHRLETTIFRLTWVFGPRDPTTLGRLVDALRARRVRWLGAADNQLNLVYATDMADAVLRAATQARAAGQIYNVAAPESSVTQREYVTAICQRLDLPLPERSISLATAARLGFLSECLAHASAYRICPPLSRHTFMLFGGQRRYSSEKLRQELGWLPRVAFPEGIQQTVDWFRNR